MNIPERLDWLVHKAGLDILTPHGAPRRRNLRWLPLLILVVLPVAYAVTAATLRDPARHGGFGVPAIFIILFSLAFGAALLIRLFGPRVGWEGGALDERELILKARAGSMAGMILAAGCALGCFYGGYAAVFGAWMPRTALEWVYLGLMIEAYALTLPVLIASWLQPPPDAEE
jgi:hypothetical protein